MRFSKQVSVVCLSLLSYGAIGFAQQKDSVSNLQASTVSLDVVVTEKSGPPIPGLQQQDFVVLDNKIARPISSFEAIAGPAAPVEAILVMDAVNTRYDTVAYERGQIEKFLLADGGRLMRSTSLAVLTDKGIEIQQGSSRDGKDLKTALDQTEIGLRTVTRSAGFYGAEERLDISLKALDGLIARESTKPGRKLVVWVSPGWPLFSGPGVELRNKQRQQIFQQVVAMSTRLRQAQITLYSINPLGTNESLLRSDYYKSFLDGVSKPSQTDAGDLALEVLATQTGGLAMTINNGITAMLQRAMSDANAYYEISFTTSPAERPDEYHKVDVQVDSTGLRARTRMGYYAGTSDAPQSIDK